VQWEEATNSIGVWKVHRCYSLDGAFDRIQGSATQTALPAAYTGKEFSGVLSPATCDFSGVVD